MSGPRAAVRLLVRLGMLFGALVAGAAPATADPLPKPSDLAATGGSFDLTAPCLARASVFADNTRVPDSSSSSRVTAYFQMENRPEDGRGSYWCDDWADWDQTAARRKGGFAEVDLYRQDISPFAFDRGYVGAARRWEGVGAAPTEVPPTNLPYSVWSFGYRTYGSSGLRQDWRVVDGRSTNGAPAGSTANVTAIVQKTDSPAQPLAMQVRAGTSGGPPDGGIVRLVGTDGVQRAWTAASSVTFSVTGLDGTCPSANRTDPARRDAATMPTCEPDPTAFGPCWTHAVANDGSPSGRLDFQADGTYAPSPYCSHLAGQTVVYRVRDRSDCPAKRTLAEYQAGGVLPSWWCTTKTVFGFCAESQVEWIGYRQRPVHLQARDEATGSEVHRTMETWYGDPEGNTSRNECPRRADGSAQTGNPRACFYEGWWAGELPVTLDADGRHALAVEAVDDTFRSWLKGAPVGMQNRSGRLVVLHRDTRGPEVAGALDAVVTDAGTRFTATDVADPGGADAAIGVNPSDVWLYACRRGSTGCDASTIPEDGAGPDRISTHLATDDGRDYATTVPDLPSGPWLWKVVPYDLLGNRGTERVGPAFLPPRAEANDDAASVAPAAMVDVDVAANDIWAPFDTPVRFEVVTPPTHGGAQLVDRPGLSPIVRYAAPPEARPGDQVPLTYRLCATTASGTDCDDALLVVTVVQPAAGRQPT